MSGLSDAEGEAESFSIYLIDKSGNCLYGW